MDTIAVFLLFFVSLLLGIYNGILLLYPLLFGLGCFIFLALRRGFPLADLGGMMMQGVDKSLIVLKIFVLIGAITAVWRACGTVSFIVYYGTTYMSEQYFILFSFLLCCLVSFLLGTSFGTVGTIGVVLIILAKSGGVNINVAAGAIIAGAYFGDRCSPMSSSASLVAALTETKLYTNIKNMLVSALLPLALSVAGYAILSHWHPLVFQSNQISAEILQSFDIGLVVLLPALIILVAAAFRIDVKLSMGLSVLAGVLIGIFVQHKTLADMLQYIVLGYHTAETGFFAGIIQGGGLYSMLNVAAIVLISSAFSGIFAGTGLLHEMEQFIVRLSHKIGLYPATILTSTAASAFGCNQTLAIILTHQFTHKIYRQCQLSNYRLALDLENTVVVISALIPWNIAGAFPAAALSADAGFILYAFYLFLVPLTNLFTSQAKVAE
ncbi:MAG: Na+/H+ antiporter NhaC family protein [Negativicutes bacterium]|nr:Na+/H+ antiporter NhaC family protein [Negativicutes bacterium]